MEPRTKASSSCLFLHYWVLGGGAGKHPQLQNNVLVPLQREHLNSAASQKPRQHSLEFRKCCQQVLSLECWLKVIDLHDVGQILLSGQLLYEGGHVHVDLLYLNLLLGQVVRYLRDITPFSEGSSDTQGSTQLLSNPHRVLQASGWAERTVSRVASHGSLGMVA